MFFGGLQTIPVELFEAASIEDVYKRQKFILSLATTKKYKWLTITVANYVSKNYTEIHY